MRKHSVSVLDILSSEELYTVWGPVSYQRLVKDLEERYLLGKCRHFSDTFSDTLRSLTLN